jgi:hypothetical protein
MMTQTLYRGRYPDQKPTQEQLELLKRMGVKAEIIQSLTRQEAFEFIKAIYQRYYDLKFKQKVRSQEAYLRW